jgi:outer membrane protein assembly factor BamB
MYVLNAFSKGSSILKYNDVCALQESGALSVWAESDIMVHPYGIARSEDAIWATCQDTGSIIRFPFDNAFNPEKITTLQQPRAMVFDLESGRILIAERLGNRTDGSAPFMGHIVVYDAHTQDLVGKYDVPGPIGMAMYHGAHGKELMVGSEMTNKVYALDPVTMKEKRSFSHAGLNHPAGISVHGDSMFVISQRSDPSRVIEFDLVSGKGKIVLDNLPGLPECLAVIPCVPQMPRPWPL